MEVIAITNQKGGVGKTTTTLNLGIGLVEHHKRVLLVDADPQGSLTTYLGNHDADSMQNTISTIMLKSIQKEEIPAATIIRHHKEGIDYVPANIELAGIELQMVASMSRERLLRFFIDTQRPHYDYILIDCMPSLGMMTLNALAAADSVIIPVEPQYLSMKGMQQLIGTIKNVQGDINPGLEIKGILITKTDYRTRQTRELAAFIKSAYGKHVRVFESEIPYRAKAGESTAKGKSVFLYDPTGDVTMAYGKLAKEVTTNGSNLVRGADAGAR